MVETVSDKTVINNRQFAMYATGAASQWSMGKIDEKTNDPDIVLRGWHLFLEAAKANTGSTRSYDWKNKIRLMLGVPDIAMILNGIRLKFDPGTDPEKPKKYQIYHDTGKGGLNEGKVIKSLSFIKGQQYGYMMNFNMKNYDNKVSFSMPVTDEQLICLDILLREAVKMISGFVNDDSVPSAKLRE